MAGERAFGADRARAGREATDWLIQLQDDPEDRDLHQRFEAWLHAGRNNAAAWAETCHVARVIAAAPPVPIAHAWRGLLPLRWPHAIGAAAAAACLAFLAGPSLVLHLRADAIAPAGAMETVRLDDGSRVQLAAGSALAVDHAPGRREVRLLRGTAFFDVTHDPAHPFRVRTADALVTVLGTAFEVREAGNGVSVAVARGRVKVDCPARPGASEFLAVGQTVTLDCTGIGARRGAIRPAKIAAWTRGQFIASDQSMREIVDEIRPWHRGIIVTRGAGIDRRRVTGVYDLRHPDRALAALAEAHHARVTSISPWITVLTAD